MAFGICFPSLHHEHPQISSTLESMVQSIGQVWYDSAESYPPWPFLRRVRYLIASKTQTQSGIV